MTSHRKPVQARAQRTYDALLDAAGHLLGEVGVERISSNMICERAGTTPPAFYRYFDDKYAIIAALAERFGSGRLSARDLTRILGAGLRGAGESVGDDEVAGMRITDGAAGAARICGELLRAAFGEGEPAGERSARP